MGTRKLNDREALCPYLRDRGWNWIRCESPLLGADASLLVKFRDRVEQERQYEGFCCRAYRRCEIFKRDEEKYQEEEDGP